MDSTPRKSLSSTVIIIILVSLVGCAGDETSDPTAEVEPSGPPIGTPTLQATATPSEVASCLLDGNDHMNLAEYRYALECSINDFSWPPGKLPDIDLMAPNDPELENAGFQPGLEHVSLGGVNTCPGT